MRYLFLLPLTLFLSCKSKDTTLMIDFQNQALHDIEVDSIKHFTYGLPFISPVQSERNKQEIQKNKIDSIYKDYGLYLQNLGCVIGDKKMDKSTKEYYKITDPFLDKRNGKGWEEKMKKEIENINKN